jgi:adenine-specific DNA methylase
MAEWGMDPVPDEPTPEGKGSGAERAFSVRNYGMNTWGDLFNSRQKLALVTFTEKVRQAYRQMLGSGYDEQYAKAVVSYLALSIDRQVDYNSRLCLWAVAGEFIAHTFGRQALPMVWDYFELCPWSEATGDWNSAVDWISRTIEHFSSLVSSSPSVTQSSATLLPYCENFFDAVITDPPYYDNVPYSYLSDFFYVWLKRVIGDIYPELFSPPLAAKKDEIVAYFSWPGGFEAGQAIL